MTRAFLTALLLLSCSRGGSRPSVPVAAPPKPLSVDERFESEPVVADADRRSFTKCTDLFLGANGCMIRVPGGHFLMGAQHTNPSGPNYDPDAADDEAPVHDVVVAPFWMHKSEVKADEYDTCLQSGGCRVAEVNQSGGLFTSGHGSSHPVNGVSWRGANDYCHWIGGRLPTEAEYEFAARGTDGRRYPWGNTPPKCPQTIMNNGCGAGGTAQVDFTGGRGNAFNLIDLAGSVWEWTSDWYAPYGKEQPKTGTQRVIRGGGWMSDNPIELRSSARSQMDPEAKLPDLGFRCVRPTE